MGSNVVQEDWEEKMDKRTENKGAEFQRRARDFLDEMSFGTVEFKYKTEYILLIVNRLYVPLSLVQRAL